MQFRIVFSLNITVLRKVGTQGAKSQEEGVGVGGDDRAERN